MADTYHFGYSEDGVYGAVTRVLAEALGSRGDQPLVLDLGCGFGAVAERCRELGLRYVGMDLDGDGPANLRERGFEAHVVDLRDTDALVADVLERLGGARPDAVLLLDTLEHLVEPPAALDALRRLVEGTAAPLVVSVPNVSHRDLGVKLLHGRWDVTPTGLLDRTHVAFFTSSGLDEAMGRSGWRPLLRQDYHQTLSDQHFPTDLTGLRPRTNLGRLLEDVRRGRDDAWNTNQFVRAYVPGSAVEPAVGPPAPTCFLSVLVRTQGRRPGLLEETLLSLTAQTVQDHEVVLLVHDAPERHAAVAQIVDRLPAGLRSRTRVVPVAGGGRASPLNAGVDLARGRYVAVVDDDDVVFADYVERFREIEDRAGGRMLRARVAEQDVRHVTWPDGPGFEPVSRVRSRFPRTFDFVEHLYDNQTPLCGLAFPITVFRDYGVRFDDDLPVLEDWDVLLRVAMLCGVDSTPATTSLYRRWIQGIDDSASTHVEEVWRDALHTVTGRLDQHSVLLPPGAISSLRRQSQFLAEAKGTIAHYERLTAELQAEWESTKAHALGLEVHARATEARASATEEHTRRLHAEVLAQVSAARVLRRALGRRVRGLVRGARQRSHR